MSTSTTYPSIFAYLLIFALVSIASCDNDFSAELSSGELVFSKDTVFLDTVFTNIGSSTYQLKVYNKNNTAITIPTISLGKGESSFYRLNVDGITGKIFDNIEILARDSIFIFVETTIDYEQVSNPLYTDAILFDVGSNLQKVQLITLVQDAHFLYPAKDSNGLIETIPIGISPEGEEIEVNGFYLSDNTTFTNEKPYVIYGYCGVPNGKTLNVDAGARIYFHENSGIIVSKDATLQILGTLTDNVLIEGDRLEPAFENTPGQWGTIWLKPGSKNNRIENAIVKNATHGFIVDSLTSDSSPTLTIKNTQIYNSSNFGLIGRASAIDGQNVVINNSGLASLACVSGGRYNFTHSTFVNFWNTSIRTFPSVYINNYSQSSEPKETMDLIANLTNTIIDGNNNIELEIDYIEGSQIDYFFKNNMIKFDDYNGAYTNDIIYNFDDTNHFIDNIFNGNPDFKSPQTNAFIIGENSDGNEKAALDGTLVVPLDILGVLRSLPSDIGAYQHIEFE